MIKTVKSGNRHGCIMWTGACSDSGYGRVRNPFSKLNNQPTMYRIHRLVYLLQNIYKYNDLCLPKCDVIGHELDVSHICHNKLCVNIDHLILEAHFINCIRRQCVCDNRCSASHHPLCLL